MEETILLPARVEAELQEDLSPLEKLKRADAARAGFPGEHWLVLAIGIGVWQFTRKHRNALVARAASGREGLSKVLRYAPFGEWIERYPRGEVAQEANGQGMSSRPRKGMSSRP